MKHHRNPTNSYAQNISIHATLALRHPTTTPTLVSPLGSIASTDDFQSNAWLNDPPPTGLGITYLRGPSLNLHDQPSASRDPSSPMQVDSDQTCTAKSCIPDVLQDDFPAHSRCQWSRGNRRAAQLSSNSFCDERDNNSMDIGLDADTNPPTSDSIVGLIPDVNMYDDLRRREVAHIGVNPLDTICNTSLRDPGPCYYAASATSTPKDHSALATDTRPEKSPSPRVIQDIMSILVQPASDFSFPWPSASPSFAFKFSPLQPTILASSTSAVPGPPCILERDQRNLLTPSHFQYPNATHPSPVLNAHLGIELDELISRAERFRNKYPERDIDRAWLSHFAGKLSDRGELLNDFRCYIIGCEQRNKRRDHILVHVGAHIGQRPFACSLCPLRFLRKNECKRHEASHSGFRPYSCDICGQSFVRQDLVKRHVKRTHGLKDENHLGTTRQSRKRAKARLV